MKKIVFMKHLSFFEATSEEFEKRLGDDRLKTLFEDLKAVFEKHGVELSSYEAAEFPMEKLSIRRCQECKRLMINRDLNPTKFGDNDHFGDHDELCLDGGTHEGRDLCEECLPISHRWGHFS